MAAEEMMGKDRHEETLVEPNQRRQIFWWSPCERNSAIEQAGFRGETATGAQISGHQFEAATR